MAESMDVADVGRYLRDASIAMGWSQRALSRRSGVPQTAISRLERGQVEALDLDQLRRITMAFGGRVRIEIDAPFLVDRARQRDRVHARSIAYVAGRLSRAGWTVATEFEIDGRWGPGWIDVLGWHRGSCALLVIEIKTEVHDLGRIQRTLDWYERRSWSAARRRGWSPKRVTGAVLLLATRSVGQRLRENRDLVRLAFPVSSQGLSQFVLAPDRAVPAGRAIALIDPLGRSARWLRPAPLDGRSTAPPHEDYAAVARRLAVRRHP